MHPQRQSLPCMRLQVRQTAVSLDAQTILSCCDDATIWRYDQTVLQAADADDNEQLEVSMGTDSE